MYSECNKISIFFKSTNRHTKIIHHDNQNEERFNSIMFAKENITVEGIQGV